MAAFLEFLKLVSDFSSLRKILVDPAVFEITDGNCFDRKVGTIDNGHKMRD